MTVVVSFIKTVSMGGTGASLAIGQVRAQERLTVGSTTTNTAQFGDVIVIGNSETSMVAVAWGTTPDGAATADASPVTSAGIAVGAGQVSLPFIVPVGSKINAKTVT